MQDPGERLGLLREAAALYEGRINDKAKAFERYRSLILTTSFLGVTGTLQIGEGVVHLIAERFWRPELSAKPTTRRPPG